MTDQEIFELTEKGINVWPERAPQTSTAAGARRYVLRARRDRRGPRLIGLWRFPVHVRSAA